MSFGQPPPPSQWISPAIRVPLRKFSVVKIPVGAMVMGLTAPVVLKEDGWAMLESDSDFRQVTGDGWGYFKQASGEAIDRVRGCGVYRPLRMLTATSADFDTAGVMESGVLSPGDVVCSEPGLVVKAYGLPSVGAEAKTEESKVATGAAIGIGLSVVGLLALAMVR